jgi:hypothetical protein
MVAFQYRCHAAQTGDIRRSQHQMPAGLDDAIHLAHHVHGIFDEVLDELAAEDGVEPGVVVREAIFFRVE